MITLAVVYQSIIDPSLVKIDSVSEIYLRHTHKKNYKNEYISRRIGGGGDLDGQTWVSEVFHVYLQSDSQILEIRAEANYQKFQPCKRH